MSPAAAWEPQPFSVKYHVHSSASGFGRRDEPFLLSCDGCCVYDLFSSSVVLLCDTVAVTQICNCRQTAGSDRRTLPGRPERGGGDLSITGWHFRSCGSHLYGISKHPRGGSGQRARGRRVWPPPWRLESEPFLDVPSSRTSACSGLGNQKEPILTGDSYRIDLTF